MTSHHPNDGTDGPRRRWASGPVGRRGIALVAAAGLIVAACGGDDESSGTAAQGADVPTVVATTSMWADVVANVACDGLVAVETIIPIGGDPHSFEPSLRDRERLDDADLVVANGLLLEESLADTVAAAEDQGTPVFRVAEHVETIEFSAGRDDHSEDEAHDEDEAHGDDAGHGEDEHAHEGDDPHVWTDPTRVAAMLPELAEVIVAETGVDAAAVDTCVADYTAELEALDAELVDTLGAIPDDARELVTNHEALGYFADRYDFEVIGTVIPAPSGLAETNPAQLEELAELIEAEGVPAVFAEAQHSAQDAEALSERVGDIEVVTLFTDALGEDGSGAETYVGLMRTNAGLIAEALG